MIPVNEPTLKGNELKYVTDCLKSNWISSNGKYIKQFENMFSAFCNVNHGVSCTSGTTALHLALAALGIGPGDEVIVPDFSIIATANAVIYTGAKPVLVDSELDTWNMDTAKIEEKITKRTKAIMPMHTYGHPMDMDLIKKIADKHDLFIIEDAAEAQGAEYKGRRCGSMSDVAAFSFYGNKIITTGEGGMVVTNNEKIAEKAALLRNHAFIEPRFHHRNIGFNYRMTNIQAAIGVAQMEYADDLVEARIRNATIYNKALSKVKGITLPPNKDWVKNVYWVYGILIDKKDVLMQKLKEEEIETRSFFYPMHLQEVYKNNDKRYPDIKGKYPNSEILYNRGIYLPSSSCITEKEIDFVSQKVIEFVREIDL